MLAGMLEIGSGVRELIQARAQRILAHPDGNFEASDGPPVVKAYTDELNIVAVDVVTGVCAEAQSSGKARHRLLAWVVGDLIGKRLGGDKAVAETVGKRLERQAGRVRASIAAAADSAECGRVAARAAAALAQDETQMAAALKAIDVDERVRIDVLNHEIYVNLHEYTVTAVAAAETTEVRLVIGPEEPESENDESNIDVAAEYSRLQEETRPYMQRWRREGGAVPPAIARRLGEEGCSMLAHELTHFRDATGDEILTIFIPGMVKGLLDRCAREERFHTEELQAVRVECATDASRSVEDLHDCERECDKLEARLAKANARADVYREIVERNLLK